MLSLSGGRAFSSHPQPDAERFFRPYRPTMVGNDEPTHQAKQPEVQHNSPTRIDDNIKKPTKETRSNTPYYFQYDIKISVISPAPHRL